MVYRRAKRRQSRRWQRPAGVCNRFGSPCPWRPEPRPYSAERRFRRLDQRDMRDLAGLWRYRLLRCIPVQNPLLCAVHAVFRVTLPWFGISTAPPCLKKLQRVAASAKNGKKVLVHISAIALPVCLGLHQDSQLQNDLTRFAAVVLAISSRSDTKLISTMGLLSMRPRSLRPLLADLPISLLMSDMFLSWRPTSGSIAPIASSALFSRHYTVILSLGILF